MIKVTNKKNNCQNTVVEILSFVGLKDFMNKFPSQLSGGQKQVLKLYAFLKKYEKNMELP